MSIPSLYSRLAHLWPLLSPAEEYAPEAAEIRAVLEEFIPGPAPAGESGPVSEAGGASGAGSASGGPSIIELGAGGGHTLCHLADSFDVTAVDLSPQMLAQCARLVPDAQLHVGDMRDIRLDRHFNAVIAHDAIDYMTTPDDVRAVCRTAAAHLQPGGVFIVAPTYVEETFTDHESATDAHTDGHTQVQLASHVTKVQPRLIELTLVLLIRSAGRLTIEEDRHTCGLFPTGDWLAWLDEAGFTPQVRPSWRTLDPADADDPPYRLFIGVKRT